MQGWLMRDEHGRSVLVRAGTGMVTAISPLGMASGMVRVEFAVARPAGRPRAVRLSVHADVGEADPLLLIAAAAQEAAWQVAWVIEWHRHDWVPADLPIEHLDLVTDARAVLVSIERVLATDTDDVLLAEERR